MGSSGGSSGKVDYPAYMEQFHAEMLDMVGTDIPTHTYVDAFNAAYGNSPWAAQSAYNPDAAITAYMNAITAYAAIIAGLSDVTDWTTFFTQADTSINDIADIADTTDVTGITEALIVADVDAFADQLDDEINSKVLPRFRAGMSDINAVVSSAFVIGEAIIEGFRNREVAKHSSNIRYQAALKNADISLENEKLHLNVSQFNANKNLDIKRSIMSAIGQMMSLMEQRLTMEDSYAKLVVEANRIKIVAKYEENNTTLEIDESDALWDLELFQYGANLLASIGGGTSFASSKKPSKTASAIGGGLSGAATGAMIGGATGAKSGSVYGAAIGAVVGAAAGLLS